MPSSHLYDDLAMAVPKAPIRAFHKWPDNGHLIAAQVELGNLHADWRTLDPTYGYGSFWSEWRPNELVACDLDPAKSPIGYPVDFTALPWPDRGFDAVVFDPPYKLNGNPSDTDGADERYGVHESTDWRERMALIRSGARECARVADKMLLVKCQDQVVSSVIRWQTRAVADVVEPLGFGLKHRFDYEGSRPQPAGKWVCPHKGEHDPVKCIHRLWQPYRQLNPRSCSSQLLVFERGWKWSDLDG